MNKGAQAPFSFGGTMETLYDFIFIFFDKEERQFRSSTLEMTRPQFYKAVKTLESRDKVFRCVRITDHCWSPELVEVYADGALIEEGIQW